MKRKNFKYKDFSKRFDYLTLRHLIDLDPVDEYIDFGDYVALPFETKFNKAEIIKPNRFVWHVTSRHYRDEISRIGLLSNREDVVYANNQSHSPGVFWPFPIDLYHWHWGISYEEHMSAYDFWRIDTHVFKAEWRVDPHLLMEYDVYGGISPYHYICTKSNIPLRAIQLFQFNPEEKFIYTNRNGVASAKLAGPGLYPFGFDFERGFKKMAA